MKEGACFPPPRPRAGPWGQGSRSRGGPVGPPAPLDRHVPRTACIYPECGPTSRSEHAGVCVQACTRVDSVGAPADLSVCPAPVDTSGVPTAPPEHAPPTGSSPWHPQAWSGCLGGLDGADRWMRVVGSPGALAPSEPRGGGSRKMGKCFSLPWKRPPSPRTGVGGKLPEAPIWL